MMLTTNYQRAEDQRKKNSPTFFELTYNEIEYLYFSSGSVDCIQILNDSVRD